MHPELLRLARNAFLWAALFPLCRCCFAADSGTTGYVGSETCAKCHQDIAATQKLTAMAKTWDAAATLPLPASLNQTKIEGSDSPFLYQVRRSDAKLDFSITDPQGKTRILPVENVIGGARHGVSFLARIRDLDHIPLARPALIEARYAYSPHGSLVLSPGFQAEKPASLENALGRLLSPGFEQRCLTCHGQPGTGGAGVQGGVHCESCHGPGVAHVNSVTAGGPQPIRPETLAGSKGTAVCAQCHTGLNNINHADPVPGDLLVSSQVPALEHSECFRQTGGDVNCTDCHSPHHDAADVAERAVKTCLRCHSVANPGHASICPVNASARCAECHMPSVPLNGFNVADHWIGVHAGPGDRTAKKDDPARRTLVPPKREYLEMIATQDRAAAEGALRRLNAGESFYNVAHATSLDAMAAAGGYAGDLALSDLDPPLADAAAHLWYGDTSGIIQGENRYVILHRLPRDFKLQAKSLFFEAIQLRAAGDRTAALAKAKAALKVYPYFLRAHIFMGTQIGETGDSARAAAILAFAAQSYPSDAFAQLQYALALRNEPGKQVEALRRAIELEPDMVSAYERLGTALVSSGDIPGALTAFRQGLLVNPLSAALNYDLGAMLLGRAEKSEAQRLLALAAKLDPTLAARH